MNEQILIFIFGLITLALFGWYFATEVSRIRRILGSVLAVFVTAFCVYSIVPPEETIQLGMDLQGGVSYELSLSQREGVEDDKITDADLEQAVEQIRERIDPDGLKNAIVQPTEDNYIFVQLPGVEVEDAEKYREILEKVAKLEFKEVHPESGRLIAQIEAGEAERPTGYRIQEIEEEDPETGKIEIEKILVRIRPEMTGKNLVSATPVFGQQGWQIDFALNREGAKQFGQITERMRPQDGQPGQRLAIVLDGEVISAPTIQSQITDRGQITGNFSQEEAQDLATSLENPLQVSPKIESSRAISASLGQDSIRSGVVAAVSGLIATLICVALYYRFAGVIALIGITINIAILFGLMAMFGFVLTLPGIAGIILTIGMAVDANVLIFERFKEERAAGKELKPSIEGAYNKALSAILDANVTTLITALILYSTAEGPIKGFAITLTLGIVASMFAALLVTRNIFDWLLFKGWLKKLSMSSFLTNTKIDFLGKRKLAALFSLFLIAVAVAMFVVKGKDTLGQDFRGGDLLRLKVTGEISNSEIRDELGGLNLGEVSVQTERTAEGQEFKAIYSPFDSSPAIQEALLSKHGDSLEYYDGESVGPRVGASLLEKSALALLLGLFGILLYVSVRFEFSFALGALAAVVHDVVVVTGIFVLLGGQLSIMFVGAVLTVAGYSINDTIVVFDRIRERLKTGARRDIIYLINESLNQTLQRTLLTSATTLVTIIILLIFGGVVLRDFALVLFLGIIVGTYSSIFVASPIVLWWARLRGQDLRTEVRRAEAEGGEGTITSQA